MIKMLMTTLAILSVPVAMAAGPNDNPARLDVLPGWRMDDGTHMAGLRITLQPGWKTYWRAPGDAGIPPQFDFAGSNNIGAVTPYWPVPEVFDQSGQRSIGYRNSVVFPLQISKTDVDAPLRITGQIDIGVCQDICIPVSLPFDVMLPMDGTREAAITAALIDQPLTATEAGIGPVTCTIAPISDGLRVTASVRSDQPIPSDAVVIEAGDSQIWVSEADVSETPGALRAVVDMVHMTNASFALDRSQVRVTLLGEFGAVELQGCQSD